MPAKRRNVKRRIDPAAELEAWSMVFSTGNDWFNDLAEFGFGTSFWDPKTEADGRAAVAKAAPDAWHRLGEEFLRTWQPDGSRAVPWALEQFGDPRRKKNAG